MRRMDTNTISLTATEAVSFVTVTCAVSLNGRYTYDIVLHENPSHSGNAQDLSFAEAHEYLGMLFAAPEYRDALRAVPYLLARVTSAVMG